MKLTDAQAFINAIISLREEIDDKTASKAISLYPTLKKSNKLISAGTRINYNNTLYRAAVDLWDTEENSPEKAENLWEIILYKDGIRIIPENITAGLVFSKNELGWWKDKIYISLLEANTYTPEQYPRGWEEYIDQ